MVPNEIGEAPLRRGPYAKSAQTRHAILDAALEVFAQSGYRSGSLRHVAERVDMSEAGLLYHFPSKSALLAAVLDLREDQSRAMFDFGERFGRATIESLLALARYNSTTPGVVELFTILAAEATSADHAAHQFFAKRYRTTVGMIRQSLSNIGADGGLRTGIDPHLAAQGAMAVWDGLQIQWLLDRDGVDVADQLRWYFNGLVVEPF